MKKIEFKGFDDWVEIFRGGNVIDSGGNEHDGDELIDKAIETFDPETHEPPLTLGHPEDNKPAYGWVEALKRDGAVLLAKFRNVVPGVEESIKKGYFKKRSASFYPDGKLRHVGFLGAVPPAIKGLADLKFKETETQIFNFEEGIIMPDTIVDVQTSTSPSVPPDISGMQGGWLAWLASIFKAGEISGAAKNIPVGNPNPAMAEPPVADKPAEKLADKPLTKDDVVTIVKEVMAAAMAEKTVTKDTAAAPIDPSKADEEKKVKMDAEKEASLQKKFAEKEAALRAEYAKKDNDAFIADLRTKGQMIPAWEKMGVGSFLERLSADCVSFDFAEGVKETPANWFKKFLSEIPKVVNFAEVAKRSDEAMTGGSSEKLDVLTKKRMSEKKMTYAAAFSEISKENPDLAAEYVQGV
ncbi:MAG: hypothetical protein EHM87_17830 [Burkholderiales bacterium]|nr:MAG: hypothetical protein EHM87_17830 [Burkholderiales bacterium]